MTPHHVIAPLIPTFALLALALQGCVGAAVGGAAAVGTAAVQERSIGDAVDDTAIYASINHHLFAKDVKLFRAVGVEVVEARVLLTGSVRSPDDRVEAVRLAWQANGVKEVINELQIADKSSLADLARDSWISTRLKSKLLFDRNIKDINYNVETVNGIVYMIGIAQDQVELERATDHARTIPHVHKVISHVRLKGSTES